MSSTSISVSPIDGASRARAVPFGSLEAICRELEGQPGDLLEWVEEGEEKRGAHVAGRRP